MTTLQGKQAVVTGASSGIGKAVALALAGAGATVTVVGRHLDSLVLLAEEAAAGRISPYQLDLDDPEAIEVFAASFGSPSPGLDILVHSAGVIAAASTPQARVMDFDWQYRINVRAAYILTQAVLEPLISARGQIVFINSSAGRTAHAGVAQYAATKHALKAIADSLREENNAHGLRILSVYPGRTASPMQQHLHEIAGRSYAPEFLLQPADVASVVIHALLMPETCEITDVFMRPMSPATIASEAVG